MIEAVNSVVSNAQLLRGNLEQVSASRALSANQGPSRGEPISVPKAPYLSLIIAVDNDYNEAVFQVRNPDNGDVLRQFPSESRLQARQQEASVQRQVTQQEVSRNTFAVQDTQFSNETPSVGSSVGGDVAQVAQAQQASQALTAGAQVGTQSQSAGISVLA